VRILIVSGFVLAVVGTESLAQEGSCLGALQSRIEAGEAVRNTALGLEADCSELKKKIDAFGAAELALRKSDTAVRRACPAGQHLRSDGSARFQFILDVAKRRLANCPEATIK
jgi:hypothetical protein